MSAPKKDVLQPLDDEARRLAKTLTRSARHAALATVTPGDGFPAASRVSVATDTTGRPGFLISSLSAHFGALDADNRCSLLLGEPGKGDPLAHPRVTVSGHARKLSPGEERDRFRARFLARHPKAALYADFGDFAFWVVDPERASLNGGFGKAYEADGSDLLSDAAVAAELERMADSAVAHMNDDHTDAIDRYAARASAVGTGWRLATIDPEGIDLTRGDEVLRLWFPSPLSAAAELRPALVAMAKQA
jgi:putative heme iron utilization protein